MRRESEVGVGGVEGGTVPGTLDKVDLGIFSGWERCYFESTAVS